MVTNQKLWKTDGSWISIGIKVLSCDVLLASFLIVVGFINNDKCRKSNTRKSETKSSLKTYFFKPHSIFVQWLISLLLFYCVCTNIISLIHLKYIAKKNPFWIEEILSIIILRWTRSRSTYVERIDKKYSWTANYHIQNRSSWDFI